MNSLARIPGCTTLNLLLEHVIFEYNTYRETWINVIAVCIDDHGSPSSHDGWNRSVAVCMNMNKIESSIPTASVHGYLEEETKLS